MKCLLLLLLLLVISVPVAINFIPAGTSEGRANFERIMPMFRAIRICMRIFVVSPWFHIEPIGLSEAVFTRSARLLTLKLFDAK